MSTAKKHSGVIVPMISPFCEDGSLDAAAAERVTEHLASNGMGVFVLGTTGEASSMDQAARSRLVEIAVKVTAGRTPVYAGIGDNCTADSIEAARQYLDMGADAVVAHLPSYYLLDEEEMHAYFAHVAKAVGRDVIIYNMPQTTRMSIPVEVIQRLSEVEGIIGMKDSENSPGRVEAVARALCGRGDFSVFMGVAVLSTQALKLGFDGLVPSSGNIAPDLWRTLYEASLAGRWEEAEALQQRLNSIAQVFQKNRSLAQSLGALKTCVASLGLCSPHVLPPLRDTDAESREVIRQALPPLLA